MNNYLGATMTAALNRKPRTESNFACAGCQQARVFFGGALFKAEGLGFPLGLLLTMGNVGILFRV